MVTRFGVWKREGQLGALALHSVAFSIFVILIASLTLRYEQILLESFTGFTIPQLIAVFIITLFTYLLVEGGLYVLLLKREMRANKLLERGEQRQWIAMSMLIGFALATLASPLVFGSWSLLLPGIPELIVIIGLPIFLRNR